VLGFRYKGCGASQKFRIQEKCIEMASRAVTSTERCSLVKTKFSLIENHLHRHSNGPARAFIHSFPRRSARHCTQRIPHPRTRAPSRTLNRCLHQLASFTHHERTYVTLVRAINSVGDVGARIHRRVEVLATARDRTPHRKRPLGAAAVRGPQLDQHQPPTLECTGQQTLGEAWQAAIAPASPQGPRSCVVPR
jgi:hypothetical protein